MNFIVRNMFYLENLFLFGLEYEKKIKNLTPITKLNIFDFNKISSTLFTP